MYCPAAFREDRPDVLRQAIAQHPFATLVTAGSRGIDAGHLPLLLYPDGGDAGCLRGHMARANPQWSEYLTGTEALAIFHGPQHYITPSWYPSKHGHGKVVPTWNYVAVHVRGGLTFHTSPDWLLENVRALTDSQEKSRDSPWQVSDTPRGYVEDLLGAIVGVELTIVRMEGKWKMSQNRPEADREGVIAGLADLDSHDSRQMSEIMKNLGRS